MTEPERVDCTDCFAPPGPDNTRIAYVKTGGGLSETWHTPDRPALAITQINMEEVALLTSRDVNCSSVREATGTTDGWCSRVLTAVGCLPRQHRDAGT
ncbi:hypothetical protein ACWD4L_42645 [Streptomyces sp. NPDC002596]